MTRPMLRALVGAALVLVGATSNANGQSPEVIEPLEGINAYPDVTCGPGFEVVQVRLGPLGGRPVGSAVDLELEEPEVDPALDLLAAVQPGDDPDLELLGVERPPGQQRVQVLAQATVPCSYGRRWGRPES